MSLLCALVIVHGGVEILKVFRLPRQLQIVLRFGTTRKRAYCGNEKQNFNLAFDTQRTTSPYTGSFGAS
jgi:hypothetical protein